MGFFNIDLLKDIKVYLWLLFLNENVYMLNNVVDID